MTRAYNRLLRPGYGETVVYANPAERPLKTAFDRLGRTMDACCEAVHLAA
jgi:hypothetical protein